MMPKSLGTTTALEGQFVSASYPCSQLPLTNSWPMGAVRTMPEGGAEHGEMLSLFLKGNKEKSLEPADSGSGMGPREAGSLFEPCCAAGQELFIISASQLQPALHTSLVLLSSHVSTPRACTAHHHLHPNLGPPPRTITHSCTPHSAPAWNPLLLSN